MKHLITLNDSVKLNNYDGIIIGNDKYAVRLTKSYDYIPEGNVYVSVNKIFHNEELNDLEEYLKTLKNVTGIIFSDFAVYSIAKKLNMLDKLIYDPTTLITNKMELIPFIGKIKGVVVSPFINLEELKEFKTEGIELYFLGNGRIPLFYSKRSLISNYAIYHEIEQNFIDDKLLLKEELRKDMYYPIIQDKNGTFVFSPYIFSCLDIENELEGIIDYLIIDLVYDNEYIKGDNKGFLDRNIVYRKV